MIMWTSQLSLRKGTTILMKRVKLRSSQTMSLIQKSQQEKRMEMG